MTSFYAHTPEVEGGEWQLLEDHLNNTAVRAKSYASEFGAGTWGYALGVLHDAGKATDAFQRRLKGSAQKVDHSTLGAKIAMTLYNSTETMGIGGTLMAFALAGHHGGVPDGFWKSLARNLSIAGFLRLLTTSMVLINLSVRVRWLFQMSLIWNCYLALEGLR